MKIYSLFPIASLTLVSMLSVHLSAQEVPASGTVPSDTASVLPVDKEVRLWSLEDCISHAVENSITVRRQEINEEQQKLQLNTSKNDLLPNLSAGANQNFSFGRGLSSDNTYINTNTSSTSFDLGSSVTLFQGFNKQRTIKANALNLKAATEDLAKAKDDISVSIAQAYVQVLYDMEILEVAEGQVGIDSLQTARLEAMARSGKASESEVAQQRATLGQSRLTAVQARNDLNIALLDLAQLLELPTPEGFGIERPVIGPEIMVPENPDDIYASAVESKASVQAEKFRLEAYDMNIKLAKSALYPTLSLSGGIGSSYYRSAGQDMPSFRNQMNNNFNQYVALSLNIPIFNKFATRNNIRSARLARQDQALQLENVRKTLYKEIQQAYYNAVAAGSRLESATDAVQSADASFRLMRAKYEGGKANMTEFNEAKNSLMKAESDLVQARYQYVYQLKLLDFYAGRPLRF